MKNQKVCISKQVVLIAGICIVAVISVVSFGLVSSSKKLQSTNSRASERTQVTTPPLTNFDKISMLTSINGHWIGGFFGAFPSVDFNQDTAKLTYPDYTETSPTRNDLNLVVTQKDQNQYPTVSNMKTSGLFGNYSSLPYQQLDFVDVLANSVTILLDDNTDSFNKWLIGKLKTDYATYLKFPPKDTDFTPDFNKLKLTESIFLRYIVFIQDGKFQIRDKDNRFRVSGGVTLAKKNYLRNLVEPLVADMNAYLSENKELKLKTFKSEGYFWDPSTSDSYPLADPIYTNTILPKLVYASQNGVAIVQGTTNHRRYQAQGNSKDMNYQMVILKNMRCNSDKKDALCSAFIIDSNGLNDISELYNPLENLSVTPPAPNFGILDLAKKIKNTPIGSNTTVSKVVNETALHGGFVGDVDDVFHYFIDLNTTVVRTGNAKDYSGIQSWAVIYPEE